MAVLMLPGAAEATPGFVLGWGSYGMAPGQLNEARSLAVGPGGVVYVADSNNYRIDYFTSSGDYLGQWGTEGTANGQFDSPEGVAVAADGTVFVADSGNHRVQYFSPTGTYLGQWGTRGSEIGEFWYPEGIALAEDGTVYVSDTYNSRIQYFGRTGTYLGQWGTYGNGGGQFVLPCGIAVGGDGSVYVTDPQTNRVQHFSSTGAYVGTWGTAGSAEGQFAGASYVAVAPDSSVYVTDAGNTRVQRFSANGTYLDAFGTIGIGNGEFQSPQGIGISSDGSIYVADSGTGRVQCFQETPPPAPPAPGSVSATPPSFAGEWGTFGYTLPGEFYCATGVDVGPNGNVYVADTNNARIQYFDAAGSPLGFWGVAGFGPGQFYDPENVAVAPDGSTYVKDTDTNRVEHFSSTGAFLGQWGSPGSGDGQFNNEAYVMSPGIAVGPSGIVYVTDTNNSRVQYFSADGTFLGKWGSAGSGDGQFASAEGIAVAPDGTVYVADLANHRIQHFSATGAYLGKFGSSGAGYAQFSGAFGVAVGPDGSVYVADSGNYRIQQFTAAGAFVSAWGSQGSGDGQFSYLYDLAVAPDGRIYVADFGNSRIQYFTPAPPPTWPTTSLTVVPSAADGGSGWYTSVPTISFSSSGTGDQTYYQWDTTSTARWTPYTGEFAAPQGEHTLNFYSVDTGGDAEPLQSQAFRVDSQAPSAPVASATSSSTSSVNLSWTTSTDDASRVYLYSVYNADTNTLLGQTSGTSWTVNGLTASTTYRFYVRVVDIAGNAAQGATVSATTAATPSAPFTTLTLSPSAADGAAGWYRSAPTIALTPNQPALTYSQWDSTSTAGWTVTSGNFQAPSGSHRLYYFSVGSSGTTETTKSRRIKLDSVPPSTPALTLDSVGASSATLSWTASTDVASGMAWYSIIDADTSALVATTTATTTTISGLAPGTSRFYVQAADVAGNLSAVSASVSASIPLQGTHVTPGAPITIVTSGVKFSFDRVTTAGDMSAAVVTAANGAPDGYRLVPGTYYELSTTAAFTGAVRITLPYDASGVQGDQRQLKLFHWKDGAWQLLATTVDDAGHTASADTTSFSPFGVFEPLASGSAATSVPASSNWLLALGVLAGLAFVSARTRPRVDTQED